MRPIRVEVDRVIRGSGVVKAPFVARVLEAAATEPEVEARLEGLCGSAAEIEVAVRITSDRELRELNRRYLGEDHATDVLSFAGGEGEPCHLGDLALSWTAVRRQAREFGHATETEAALLLVHGLLHLAGYDHASAKEEAHMWSVTRRCLAILGIRPAEGRLQIGGAR